MTYESFIQQCKDRGASKPYMSLKQFNECMGIEVDKVIAPMQVRPKQDRRKIDAVFTNYEKVECEDNTR